MTITEESDGFRPPSRDPLVREAGSRILRKGLGDGLSSFDLSRSAWSADVVRQLNDGYRAQAVKGEGSFLEKLRAQTAGLPDDATLLLAELLTVQQLPLYNLKPATKIQRVQSILSWMTAEVHLPDWVAAAFEQKTWNGGQAALTLVWHWLFQAGTFLQHWWTLSDEERAVALTDPTRLRHILDSGPKLAPFVSETFAYLLFPAYFLPIVNLEHKKKIRQQWAGLLNGPTGGLDADLLTITRILQGQLGGDFDYYEAPWLAQWEPPAVPPNPPIPPTSPVPPILAVVGRPLPLPDPLLATELHLDQHWLNNLVEILNSRRQVALYGPPGTGKTFVARALARHLTATANVRLVQFHPSYSYEDFFEGFRPVRAKSGEGIGFELRKGPLRLIAEQASAEPDSNYILIIDELNRANLAKVFGELYFLLEYREEGVNLQYSPTDDFRIPDNLYFIGTMNTADRSIALVDAAIRRRFAFVEMHPDSVPVKDVLRRYVLKSGLNHQLPRLLQALNAAIGESDRDFQIGPSYLMRPEASTEQGLRRIWEVDLLPLLEQHYYGRMSRSDIEHRFGFDAIQREIIEDHAPDPTASPTTTDGLPNDADETS